MRVSLIVDGQQLLDRGLSVALRGRKRDVAEQFLNGAQVRTIGEQVGGKSVS